MGWLVMFMALLVWLPNHCAGLDGSFGLILLCSSHAPIYAPTF